ncbi:hypothetical protein LCGC14_2897200 [marine sediment metagenome]|uniref:Uncharacterized protein n=1 Tax=marine sediment metagenome TaxID=412755 RepID=A0A0F8XVH2_9ZZZZ
MTDNYPFQAIQIATGRKLCKWLVGCVLVLVASGLAVELLRTTTAEAQVTSASQSNRMLAVAGQITPDTYGLYIVDLENSIITVYGLMPGKPRKFKLMAARNFAYDIQLDEYNTEPSPNEIKRLVLQGRSIAAPPKKRNGARE